MYLCMCVCVYVPSSGGRNAGCPAVCRPCTSRDPAGWPTPCVTSSSQPLFLAGRGGCAAARRRWTSNFFLFCPEHKHAQQTGVLVSISTQKWVCGVYVCVFSSPLLGRLSPPFLGVAHVSVRVLLPTTRRIRRVHTGLRGVNTGVFFVYVCKCVYIKKKHRGITLSHIFLFLF